MQDMQRTGGIEQLHADVGGADRHRVEELLIVQPREDADPDVVGSELEDLPGISGVSLDPITGSFDVRFDPAVVSDDELAAALNHQGYDLVSWQEVRAMRAAQQRIWLLEQIQSLSTHADTTPGSYASGVTKGSVDAYVRAARAFGLVTDAEIVELLPPHFLDEA